MLAGWPTVHWTRAPGEVTWSAEADAARSRRDSMSHARFAGLGGMVEVEGCNGGAYLRGCKENGGAGHVCLFWTRATTFSCSSQRAAGVVYVPGQPGAAECATTRLAFSRCSVHSSLLLYSLSMSGLHHRNPSDMHQPSDSPDGSNGSKTLSLRENVPPDGQQPSSAADAQTGGVVPAP